MVKTGHFSASDVSEYLIGRLLVDRDSQLRIRRDPRNRRAHGDKGKRTVVLTERVLLERISLLERLVVGKEDLERQVVSDERLFEGQDKSVTQEDMLAALQGFDAKVSGDLRPLARAFGPHQAIEESRREAKRRLAAVKSEIRDILAENAVRHLYRENLIKRIETARAARSVGALETLKENMLLARMELFARRNGESAALTGADKETLRKLSLTEEEAARITADLMSHDDVYYEARRRSLLECRKQLLNGGFVETAGVKRDVMDIISHLRLGVPVLLRGHLGAGKTEMAIHVARKYFHCEPEFISGSEEATKYDIYGKTQIGVRPEEQKRSEFRQRMEEYLLMNPETTREELRNVEKQYYETIIVKGLTTSFFQHGPLIRAMKGGKPLIIDEMDGIPHSIIMRLNHVLTRRPGDIVQVQENGGGDIVVEKGFCVMATGNIRSARYKREDLDAAFLSRWWSLDVGYPSQSETYEILLSSLVDRRGNLQIRAHSDLDDLKRLTQAASEIQRIFSGEQLDYLGEGGDAAREIPATLKKTVLSLRHLWNIVRPWRANNFDRPLEEYILTEFIKPAVAEDRIYLMQLCCRFRFFKDWKAHQFEIPGLTEARLLAFQGKQTLGVT